MKMRSDEGGVDLFRYTSGWSVVVLRFEEVWEEFLPEPPRIAKLAPVVDVLLRRVGPRTKTDGARSFKLTFDADGQQRDRCRESGALCRRSSHSGLSHMVGVNPGVRTLGSSVRSRLCAF